MEKSEKPALNDFEISTKTLKSFNWGALLMGWIWGIFNRVWITLIQLPLSYIPKVGWILGLICAIVFGLKGNSWALKYKKFENIEEFNKYQKKFIYAGIVLLIITFFASWITIQTSMLTKMGNLNLALYIVQLATIIVLGSFILMLVYLMSIKKSQKIILAAAIIAVSISLSILPSLGWLGAQALQMEEYDDAAIIYKTMAKLSISPINKNKYYNLTAACYIEKKDINNIIKYFEKAENADQTHFNPESGMLTDLYIIKGEKEKIQTREDKYKLNALNSDWQGAIIELNSKISNPKNGTAIDGEIYAPADLYLARAIAYRNIGKTEDAKKDLQNALKLSSPNQADYINSAFNNYKNYYKEYYNQIKTTLEVK